jgi:hypothetical protein
MLKKIKYIIAGLTVALVPVLAVGYVSADACISPGNPVGCSDSSKTSVCEGIGLAGTNNGCTEDANSPSVNSTVHAVITILSSVVGILSVIMIIVGGFRYVTSGGDSAKVGSAKSTILYAVVGLVIVAMAQVIVRFTINKTNAPPASSAGTTLETPTTPSPTSGNPPTPTPETCSGSSCDR